MVVHARLNAGPSQRWEAGREGGVIAAFRWRRREPSRRLPNPVVREALRLFDAAEDLVVGWDRRKAQTRGRAAVAASAIRQGVPSAMVIVPHELERLGESHVRGSMSYYGIARGDRLVVCMDAACRLEPVDVVVNEPVVAVLSVFGCDSSRENVRELFEGQFGDFTLLFSERSEGGAEELRVIAVGKLDQRRCVQTIDVPKHAMVQLSL